MTNICMTVSYDGTPYHGFQVQPGKITVQQCLEHAIQVLTGEEVKIHCSGRTDAGVHALGQVFNFHTSSSIPVERWALALNARLPDDIIVRDAKLVPDHFHARRFAKRKTYRYTIRHGKFPDVRQRLYEFHHPTRLDVEAMRAGLQYLVGEHDFVSFCSIRSTKKTTVRTIFEARLECEPWDEELQSEAIHIYVSGNGFLYNMVRIIVGTLLQVGEGKRTSEDMKAILEAKSRAKAGPTAMAHGLMLWKVFYEDAKESIAIPAQM